MTGSPEFVSISVCAETEGQAAQFKQFREKCCRETAIKADDILWLALGIAGFVGAFLRDHRHGIAVVVALLCLWGIAFNVGWIAGELSAIYELLELQTREAQRGRGRPR